MGRKFETMDKKIVILGDKSTGKTSVLQNMEHGHNYISEKLMRNKYELRGKSKSKSYTRIIFWDGIVSGYRTDYRPIAYKNTDMIILFYAIDSRISYESIKTKWLPEVRTFAPEAPVMVIGNMRDKRDSEIDQELITWEEGSKLARDIQAIGFLECSAYDKDCLDMLVQTLLENFSTSRSKRKESCVLM